MTTPVVGESQVPVEATLDALGRILTSISGSTLELGPTLDEIAETARGLSAADGAFCFIREGELLIPHGQAGVTQDYWQWLRDNPLQITTGTAAGRAVLSGEPSRISDTVIEPGYTQPQSHAIGGYRSILAVPIRSGSEIIGGFALGRQTVAPFDDRAVQLASVFADQAAVAIRIAQLLAEGRLAQDREQSVAQVLGSIARPEFDLDEVLQAVIDEACRLCEADTGNIAVRDGDAYRIRATVGFGSAYREAVEHGSYTADRGSVIGRTLLERRVVQIHDVLADPDYALLDLQKAGGYRTAFGVPIWLDGEIIGVIATARNEVRPFTEREVSLVETFASQVAIALNIGRLLTETRDALERESAVSRVVQEIARSTFDLDQVLQTVINNAVTLCRADRGNILGQDGESFRVITGSDRGDPEYWRMATEYRHKPGRGTAVGRALLERATVHIADVRADLEYEFGAIAEKGNIRTTLVVPMLRDGNPIGVMAVWRTEVRPFSDREVAVLETFADQVAIALNIGRLLTDSREALERESAVGQVLQTISRSTFDLQRVLQTVIDSAVRLSHADDGNILRDEGGAFRLAAYTEGVPESFRAILNGRPFVPERGSVMGRALLELGPVQVADVLADPEYELRDAQKEAGFRTMLGMPLLRDGSAIGALAVWRFEIRPFSEAEIALLQTFADQAAIAISNVRLFEMVERQRTELARFAPEVAGMLTTTEGQALLAGHRREISALFCDLRGFTAFTEMAEPEELFTVLRQYHAAVGEIVTANGGTVEHFAGDGLMVFFNDPTPMPDHQMAAIRSACAMRERFAELSAGWRKRGYELGLGIGIAVGYATLGRIGFEGRHDYAAIGPVVNLASRLSDVAGAGEILINQRMHAMVEDQVDAEPVSGLELKGFSHAVAAYKVLNVRD